MQSKEKHHGNWIGNKCHTWILSSSLCHERAPSNSAAVLWLKMKLIMSTSMWLLIANVQLPLCQFFTELGILTIQMWRKLLQWQSGPSCSKGNFSLTWRWIYLGIISSRSTNCYRIIVTERAGHLECWVCPVLCPSRLNTKMKPRYW
jgi:hypothetical protein